MSRDFNNESQNQGTTFDLSSLLSPNGETEALNSLEAVRIHSSDTSTESSSTTVPVDPRLQLSQYIAVRCPCKNELVVPRTFVGQIVTCRFCNHAFRLSDPIKSKVTIAQHGTHRLSRSTSTPQTTGPAAKLPRQFVPALVTVEPHPSAEIPDLAKNGPVSTPGNGESALPQAQQQQSVLADIEITAKTAASEQTEPVDLLAAEIARVLSRFCEQDREAFPAKKGRGFRKLTAILGRDPKPSAQVLCEALIKMAHTGDSRAFAWILKHIRARSPDVRQAAVTALGILRERRCVPALLRCLSDRRSDVSLEAVSSLAACAEPQAIRPVLAFGLSAPQNRVAAIESITQMGQPVVGALVDVANGGDVPMAALAIVALGRFDCDAAKNTARQFIGHSRKTLCLNAITAFTGLATRKDAKELYNCLGDRRPEVRRATAKSLTRLPHPANIKPLVELISRDDEQVDVLCAAAEALGATENPRALEGLCRLVQRCEASIDHVVAEAIGRTGDESELAIQTLMKLAESDDTRVKFRSVVALTRLNDSRAMPIIVGSLDDNESNVRRQAVVALGQVNRKDAARLIVKHLKRDPSDEVRAAAAKALGKPGRKSAIGHLERALKDEVNVRCQAVVALRMIGDKAVVPMLMQSLADPAPEVRYQAVNGLVKLKEKTAIPSLVAHLNDSDAMVVRATEKGLRELGANRQIIGNRLRKTRQTVLPDFLIGLAVSPWTLVCTLLIGLGIWGVQGLVSAGTLEAARTRGSISGLAYSPDGQLAVVTRGGWLEIWSPADNTMQQQVKDANGREVAFQSTTQIVVSSPTELVVYSPSPDSTALMPTPLARDFDHPPESLCVTSTNVFALSGQTTFKTVTGKPARKLPTARLRPKMIAISSDGTILFTAGATGVVTAIDVESGKSLANGRLDKAKVFGSAMAISPDGLRLAVGTTNGKISLREVGHFDDAIILAVPGGQRIRAIEFLPDSETLVICDDLGVTVWPLPTNEPTRLKCIAAEQAEILAVAPDGKTIAVGSRSEAVVRIVNLDDGTLKTTLDPQ